MQAHYNALIVALSITMLVFHFAKPLFIEFMSVEDYTRRRNIWLCIVALAFLISNYWVYALIASIVLAYGAKHDKNPVAMYLLLLMAVPPFASEIPTFGIISQIFDLDHLRLLSLVVLLPMAVRMRADKPLAGTAPQAGISSGPGLLWPDILLLSYLGLQWALVAPSVSITDSIRRGLLLGIDVLLPYFVVSRACRTKQSIVDTMASFALAASVLSCLAVFENLKSWLLFPSIEDLWGSLPLTSFMRRGESLRAQVTSGHSIVLGYALAVGVSFWLYLQTRVSTSKMRWAALLSIVAGLAATLARGPWVGALVMALVNFGLGPKALSRLFKALGVLTLAFAIMMATPFGDEFLDRFPFLGTADQEGSVVYRQRIAAASWQLIQQNPFFGNLAAGEAMEDLRQGEGIIDMVNTYAFIALTYGLVGLGLFVGFFFTIMSQCFRQIRRFKTSDPDMSLLGSALVATLIGSLLIIATVGLYLSIGYLIWIVAALGVAYVQLAKKEASTDSNQQRI